MTEEEYLRFQNGTLKNNNVLWSQSGITNNMINNLKSQSGTSSLNNNYGGVRKLPYVFTEQGVAMLSSVLRTEVASKVSINIMRAFVTMRHLLLDKVEYQKELFIIQNKVLEIDNKLIKHDSKFEEIFTKFDSDELINRICLD